MSIAKGRRSAVASSVARELLYSAKGADVIETHRWFRSLPLRLRSLFRRESIDRDFDDELQSLLDLTTDKTSPKA